MSWRLGGMATAGPVLAAVLLCAPLSQAQTYRINNVDKAARIHLREAPNNRARVVAYIPPDQTLQGTGNCNERWCEVSHKGRKGWVFRKYLIEPRPAVAAAPPNPNPDTVAALPPQASPAASVAAPDAKEVPLELQDKMLRLKYDAGRDIAVYAFPSDRLPAAGRIPPETAEVEDLGTCTRKFCYVRSGSLVGWISEEAIVKPAAPMEPPKTVETTVAAATQAAVQANAVVDALGSIEMKSYTLVGLSGDAGLPLRDEPEDNGGIVGWVPADAKGVEGLRRCVQKWCLVRYEALTGWIARRHLADEDADSSRRYQVSGVALWAALDVFDYPGPDASIVGHIPSYASGIAPIGNCDREWCHIRYLGIAGWVSAKFLAPQARR